MLKFDNSQRDQRITVLFTARQVRHLRKMAQFNQTSVSAYIRYLVDLDRQGYNRELGKATHKIPTKKQQHVEKRSGEYKERRVSLEEYRNKYKKNNGK